jgi:mannose-6-phosphate isomerase-like protein (cupin superfamily)
MDRREFAALLPALLAAHSTATAQATKAPLNAVESGAYKPGPARTGSLPKRTSRAYTRGILKAGNIQLEIHETTQEVGAPHEPEETHLHSEIWLVREGTIELTVNGVPRRLEANDIGICAAGDKHYLQNAGDTPATYFVVAVGPPE